MRQKIRKLILVAIFHSLIAYVNAAITFNGLGDLAGGRFESKAENVSADGSVVVGWSNSSNGDKAFRWTRIEGMIGLGNLPAGATESYGHDTSSDGSVIVGGIDQANGEEAFRWTIGDGLIGLGDFPGGDFKSWASGISNDGSIIVGTSDTSNGFEAFRWNSGSGMVGLGDLPGGSIRSQANAVSADGLVVVGQSESSNGDDEAFIWTSTGGMVALGALPSGDFESAAEGVSADGSVVVGYSNSVNGGEAFRWTSAGGMIGLGSLGEGFSRSVGIGVSADGSVIVGSSYGPNGLEAIVWDGVSGMQSLTHVLTDAGVDLVGWSIRQAVGISDDGSVIVGWGTNPDGNTEAWIVEGYSPVPKPRIPDVTVNDGAEKKKINLFEIFDDSSSFWVTTIKGDEILRAAVINEDTRILTLCFEEGKTGSAELTLRVTDTDGLWIEETFSITVLESLAASEESRQQLQFSENLANWVDVENPPDMENVSLMDCIDTSVGKQGFWRIVEVGN